MNWKPTIGVVLAAVFVFALGSSPAAFAEKPTDACSLLTTAQVSAALGVTVGPGKHTNDPSIPAPPPPLDKLDCYWWQQGKPWLGAKRVVLELVDPSYNFDHPLLGPGGTKTPVSGVGDAAYYVVMKNLTDLWVKKGSSIFHITIGGFADNEAGRVKAIAKKLAQQATAKL